MIDNKVFVTYGEGALLNAKKALLSCELGYLKNKSVLVKPNIGRIASPGKGINTHPDAIAGVIEALQETGCAKIAIGESPILGVDTLVAFKKAGVEEVANKYGVELIDMDRRSYVVKNIPNPRILDSTKICDTIFEFDYILSLPVAKSHMHTGVTLGIKNMKGCLYRREKVRYHQLEYKEGFIFPDLTLDTAISDLATILLPSLTVIDGFIGMEGLGPSGGDIVEANFAVASNNPMAADVAGCLMMGRDSKEVGHLRIISERLNISLDPKDYDISPIDFEKHSVKFRLPPKNIAIEYPDVVLYDKESCSACLSTVMFFLKRFKNDMSQYLLEDNKLHLAIGKGVKEEDIPVGTVCIGNCARSASAKGIFVPGCPPVPTQIYKAITGVDPDENEPEIN